MGSGKMSQTPKKQVPKGKRNWRIKNNYRCFGILDIFIIIGVIVLFILPFIDIFLYQYAGGYNVVDWGEYYNKEGDAFRYDFNGDSFNGTVWFTPYNFTTDFQKFQMKTDYQEVQVAVDKDQTKFKNVSLAFQDYQFLTNGSSDMEFVSEYSFNAKAIQTFYPLMMQFPIHILSVENVSVYDYITSTFSYYIDFKGLPISFPSNWSSVWDNLDLYFYYVNDNNEGIGFRYGNNQFNGTTETNTLITDFGTLSLRTYEINISSELRYVVKYKTQTIPYGYLPELVCHVNPMPSYSPFKQYNDLFSGLIGNPVDMLNGLLGTIPINVNIGGGEIPNAIVKDNPLYEIYQLRGFPTPEQLPTITASKCGYYIKVKSGFDCSNAFNFTTQANEYWNQILLNGIEFNDDAVYLGKISLIQDTLYRIILYDVIIFGSYLGIVFIFVYVNKVPQKYKAFKEQQNQYCRVVPKTEPQEPQNPQ